MHKQIPDFSYSSQRPTSNPQAHDALKVLIFLDISPETSFPSIVVWGSCAKREISQAFCKQILHCLSTVLVMSGKKKADTEAAFEMYELRYLETSPVSRRSSFVRKCTAILLWQSTLVTLNVPTQPFATTGKIKLMEQWSSVIPKHGEKLAKEIVLWLQNLAEKEDCLRTILHGCFALCKEDAWCCKTESLSWLFPCRFPLHNSHGN